MASTPASEEKAALRRGLLGRRRAQVADRDRESDDRALAGQVLALVTDLGLGPGDTVAAYESMRSEPPLTASIAALVTHGIRVLVPVTLPDNDLDWCDASDPDRAPAGPDAVSAARLVLAPGLAVDRTGTRLGRGGGSYDRALARRAATARVVVVLHPGEVHAEALPRDDHDVRVDGVLTADGLEWF